MAILASPPEVEQELVGDVRVESVLQTWRVPFELELVELKRLKVEDESQVRVEAHRAPRSMVKEYMLQMRAGAVFPPLVVDRQGWRLLDGNTRKAAGEALERETMPAYVVKCNDDDVRLGLAAALNQMGGKRLDEADAMRAAETLEHLGMTDDQVARYIGRSTASVRSYRAERKFNETVKLAEIEPEAVAKLPKAAKRKISRVGHVEPFREVVDLAVAGVKGEQLEQAVKAAETARSDHEAVSAVQEMRSELAPQAPPPAGRARSSTGKNATKTVHKLLEQTESLDVSALAGNGNVEAWRQLADRLAGIVRELDAIAAGQ